METGILFAGFPLELVAMTFSNSMMACLNLNKSFILVALNPIPRSSWRKLGHFPPVLCCHEQHGFSPPDVRRPDRA
ncbi:MAG: hypothetical protein RR762_15995, partial [Glutamicibacter sp.]|uniref:hypothetical protein n=1 Tax=Glutamicibacter sp. TaxID=1931995 RepID=UPI002FC874E6